MIEFDVDMGYLLEAGELDCVILNDENGEHEPMEFVPKAGIGTFEVEPDGWYECQGCGCVVDYWLLNDGSWTIYMDDYQIPYNNCPNCGMRVVR